MRLGWAIVASFAVLLSVPAVCITQAQQPVAQNEQGNPDIKVWVNTASGVYHCPGSRWYGKTKRGEYMSQKQARERGHRPAHSKPCP